MSNRPILKTGVIVVTLRSSRGKRISAGTDFRAQVQLYFKNCTAELDNIVSLDNKIYCL